MLSFLLLAYTNLDERNQQQNANDFLRKWKPLCHSKCCNMSQQMLQLLQYLHNHSVYKCKGFILHSCNCATNCSSPFFLLFLLLLLFVGFSCSWLILLHGHCHLLVVVLVKGSCQGWVLLTKATTTLL
jgi:hypothetical protein